MISDMLSKYVGAVKSVLKKLFKINDIQLVHLLVVWYLVNLQDSRWNNKDTLSRVFLGKLIVCQLVILRILWNPKITAAFTASRHWFLSWVKTNPPHALLTSRYIVILSSRLRGVFQVIIHVSLPKSSLHISFLTICVSCHDIAFLWIWFDYPENFKLFFPPLV